MRMNCERDCVYAEQSNNQWRAGVSESFCLRFVRVVVKLEKRNGADIDEAEENENGRGEKERNCRQVVTYEREKSTTAFPS